MEVRELKTKNLVIGALLGTLVMCILWIVTGLIQEAFDADEIFVDSGITIVTNGEISENESLSNKEFSVKKGDKVELIIPFNAAYNDGKTMLMLLYLCGVEAYVGDDLIYSYGLQGVAEDTMVGSGYHFLELPSDLNGRDIHINIYVNENNAFTSIDVIHCVATNEAYNFFAGRSIIGLINGVFLTGLGVILIVAGLLATLFSKDFLRLPLIGFFSLSMGLWSFSGQKTFQLFTRELEFWSLMEYVLLYLAPMPLLGIVYHLRDHENGWKKWVLLGDSFFYIAFVAACMILHFLNIVRLPQTLMFFHIQGVLVLVISVVVGVFMVRNKSRAEMLFQMAVFVLCGAIGIDILRFNLQKYVLPNSIILQASILPVATLVFILMLIMSYIVHLYDMLMTKTEKEMLTQLAYHDILTGLYNRTKANERFAELAGSKDEYCVISLDVNGLKYVNDTYGHEEGDRMLKNFGKNLHEAFRGVGKCYRMGGDEFMAVVRKHAFSDVEKSLNKLTKLQNEVGAITGYEFDASYGIAYSKEMPGETPEKVYSVADDRMYKMKLQKHNSRAARERHTE